MEEVVGFKPPTLPVVEEVEEVRVLLAKMQQIHNQVTAA
jgi:hypothetical protein